MNPFEWIDDHIRWPFVCWWDKHHRVRLAFQILGVLLMIAIIGMHAYTKMKQSDCYTHCKDLGYEHYDASYQKCTCYKGGTQVVEEPDAK